MLTGLILVGLVTVSGEATTVNDKIVSAYLEHMKLATVCTSPMEYEWAEGMARRAIMRALPDTKYKVVDVAKLDKEIREGGVQPAPKVNMAKCEELLKNSHADVDLLKDQ